jgi:hypothetical protein
MESSDHVARRRLSEMRLNFIYQTRIVVWERYVANPAMKRETRVRVGLDGASGLEDPSLQMVEIIPKCPGQGSDNGAPYRSKVPAASVSCKTTGKTMALG